LFIGVPVPDNTMSVPFPLTLILAAEIHRPTKVAVPVLWVRESRSEGRPNKKATPVDYVLAS